VPSEIITMSSFVAKGGAGSSSSDEREDDDIEAAVAAEAEEGQGAEEKGQRKRTEVQGKVTPGEGDGWRYASGP
jgi:hypothetical protein